MAKWAIHDYNGDMVVLFVDADSESERIEKVAKHFNIDEESVSTNYWAQDMSDIEEI